MEYIIIKPDEDGNPISWLHKTEIDDIKQLMEDYGIKEFITEFPDGESNPNYWGEGQAILLEVKIKKIIPKKVVEEYQFVETD